MKERQLSLPVGRIIKRIHIQGQLTWWFLKGSDKLVDEHVLKSKKRPNINCIFESRKCWLIRQVRIVRRPITEQLKDRITIENIVVILIFLVG